MRLPLLPWSSPWARPVVIAAAVAALCHLALWLQGNL